MIEKIKADVLQRLTEAIEEAQLSEADEARVLERLQAISEEKLPLGMDKVHAKIEQLVRDINLAPADTEMIQRQLVENPEMAQEIFSELWKVKQRFDRVCLDTILFNWEGSTHKDSGIPIPQDFTGWVRDSYSCVAYSLADTREVVAAGKLKIRARFHTPYPETRIQVRTQNAPIYMRDLATGQIRQNKAGKRALGDVKPTTIFFNQETGYSIYRGKNSNVPLPLKGVNFQELGVGIYDINWKWEYRQLIPEKDGEKAHWEEKWHHCAVTKHRVFVVLDTPQAPWTPRRHPNLHTHPPYDLPIDVGALTHACEWARGCKTVEEASQMIVTRLYTADKFTYHTNSTYYQEVNWMPEPDNEHGVETPILIRNFYWSKVAERLNGGFGLGRRVNCLDCALIVMTLANVLGARLRVGKLQASPETDTSQRGYLDANRFAINPIRAIGHADSPTTMAKLQSGDRHYFTFHAVAWQAARDENGEEIDAFDHAGIRIYDACLQFFVDETGEMGYVPASGMEFGTAAAADQDKYLQRLAIAGDEGQARCVPQGATEIQVQLK